MSDNVFEGQGYKSDGLNFGSWVRLPFPHLQLSWKNGDGEISRGKDSVVAFGGWYCSDKYYIPAVTEINKDLPDIFSVTNFVNKQRKQFEVIQARAVYMSYISGRFAWFLKKDGSWQTRFEVLGLLGVYDSKAGHYAPWAPIVLSVKGKSGTKGLQDALKAWQLKTANPRKEHANNWGWENFFFPYGTFGDEPVVKDDRGADGTQYSYNPIQIKEPVKEIDRKFLEVLFIGHDRGTLELVREYAELAKPWVADFAVQAKRSKQGGVDDADDDDAGGDASYNPTPEDSEIPF